MGAGRFPDILLPHEAYAFIQQKDYDGLKKFYISDNFTWAEVFHRCRESDLETVTEQICRNAWQQAKAMQTIRWYYDSPVIVTSWYRSPQHNLRVGGSSRSYHMQGLATDFVIMGYNSTKGNRIIQKQLDKMPFMQNCGLEFTNGNWTHVDSRGWPARFKP